MQENPPLVPATTRSRIVLEVASELVGSAGWTRKQARIDLRVQGSDNWDVSFFGSDSPGGLHEVAEGRAQIGIVNPCSVLTLGYKGTGPFKEPLPLRAVTVIPSYDQLVFAVAESTGITCLEDVVARKYPLKVSLRGQRDHSVHLVVDQVLAAVGFSLEDIVSWGGEVRYDPGLPDGSQRLGAIERGEIDGIFDEAVVRWTDEALRLGMRMLPLKSSILGLLEDIGFRRGVVAKADYPGLPADVPTLDFSGFVAFTHADVDDSIITAFCEALDVRKDRIPWEGDGPLPLDRMARDTAEGPLDVPLHPAAELYWREHEYL